MDVRYVAHKVLQLTHGRTTMFFGLFFVAGHVMALAGKLTREYVAYMGMLGSLVLLHSTKESIWPSKLDGTSKSSDDDEETKPAIATSPGPQGATPG